jgi:NAD(P)-dependent dehydrogenase (short-subunit alcohol dehydrogenase family)
MSVIEGSRVVVTGGQRGLGKEFVTELLARGAAAVYVAARHPVDTGDPRLIPIPADVTDPDAVAALADAAEDATIVINNAGLWSNQTYLEDTDLVDTRQIFETNFFGPLHVIRAFAPVLKANGGGAVVNMNSLAAWTGSQDAYNASKAALWSATNALRVRLRAQGTQVLSVHVGPIDTDMARSLDIAKSSPHFVAATALDALARGDSEVLVDEATRAVKAALCGPVDGLTFSLSED